MELHLLRMFPGIKLAVPQLCSRFEKHKVSDYGVNHNLVSTCSQAVSQPSCDLRVFHTLLKHSRAISRAATQEGSESSGDCLGAAPEELTQSLAILAVFGSLSQA